MNKVTYASEYVDGLFADAERAGKRIAELESHNRACDDIIGRLVGQFSASGLHAVENSLNPAQALFYDALQVMKGNYPTQPLPAAITDIIAERQRQKDSKGYTETRDDNYLPGVLSLAGAAYAVSVSFLPDAKRRAQRLWPWPDAGKYLRASPKDPRSALVKACALIAAEIERIDRQSVQVKGVQS